MMEQRLRELEQQLAASKAAAAQQQQQRRLLPSVVNLPEASLALAVAATHGLVGEPDKDACTAEVGRLSHVQQQKQKPPTSLDLLAAAAALVAAAPTGVAAGAAVALPHPRTSAAATAARQAAGVFQLGGAAELKLQAAPQARAVGESECDASVAAAAAAGGAASSGLGPAGIALMKQELAALPSQQQLQYWQQADRPFDSADLQALLQQFMMPRQVTTLAGRANRSGSARPALVDMGDRVTQQYPALAPALHGLLSQLRQQPCQQQQQQPVGSGSNNNSSSSSSSGSERANFKRKRSATVEQFAADAYAESPAAVVLLRALRCSCGRAGWSASLTCLRCCSGSQEQSELQQQQRQQGRLQQAWVRLGQAAPLRQMLKSLLI
jgi:hypothetical protein